MFAIHCEMCDSTDIIKQDGVFVCRNCGMKYSLEEARKMLTESPDSPVSGAPGAPGADNSTAIENYLKLAKNALDANNHEEAENYANKTIELDPENSTAWEIKGEAAGWQSKTLNNRIGEAVTAWINAIKYAAPENKHDLRERVADGYCRLLLAMLQLRAGNFGEIQSDQNLKSTLDDLQSGIDQMNTLMTTAGVSFNRSPIYVQIARKLNDAACEGYKDAEKDFGPEHRNMSKWQWERHTNACDNCITMLEKAKEYCRDNALGTTICDNLVTIAESVRDSSSWKFDVDSYTHDHYVQDYTFTQKAIEIRNNGIRRYKESKQFFSKKQADAALDLIQGDRIAEEIASGKEAYWAEHAEEKAGLEEEKKILTEAINGRRQAMKDLPISVELAKTEKQIGDLEEEQKALGLFKVKEKKALQEQIDVLEKTRESQKSEENEAKQKILSEMEKDQKRVKAIDKEFTMPRGQITKPLEGVTLPNAVVDGKFNFTAREFSDHLGKALSSVLDYKGLSDESCSDFGDFGNQYEVNLCEKSDDEDEESGCGINVYVVAENEDAKVTHIILETTAAQSAGEDSIKNWGIVGSYIFMALFGDMQQSEAEKSVVDLRYDSGRTLWTRDGIRYEYAGCVINLMNILSVGKDYIVFRADD